MIVDTVLLYNDMCQDSLQYSTRTITDSSAFGAADAARPVANLFDVQLGKTWRRTGVTNTQTAILDFRFDRTGGVYGLYPAAVVLANLRCISEVTGAPASATVTCTIGNAAFGGTQTYNTTGFPVPGLRAGACITLPFVFANRRITSAESPEQQTYHGGLVGSASTHYVRITLTNTSGANVYFDLGRILMMSGFWATQDVQGLEYSTNDQSEVLRSYSGAAYPLPLTPQRTVSGQFKGLRNWQVIGGFPPGEATYDGTSTINAVNALSGTTKPVCFVPYDLGPKSGGAWTANNAAKTARMSMLGFLQQPLAARYGANIDGQDGFWSAGFQVLELLP